MTAKDEAEVVEFVEEVKETLKSQELQQDLDRRALDSDLADEFTDGPLPFTTPDEEGDPKPGSSKTGGGAIEISEEDPGVTREPSTVQQHRLNRVKTQLRSLNIEHQIMRLGKDTPYKIWRSRASGTRRSWSSRPISTTRFTA